MQAVLEERKMTLRTLKLSACLKVKDQQTCLDGEGEIIRSKNFIEMVNSLGKIIKGNASGKYMQIELPIHHSPLTIHHSPLITHHSPLTINLDLFMPDDFDYYRQYAIRTGSAEYAAKVIAAGWKKIGWCGSDKGLRKIEDCINMPGPDGKSKWRCIKKDAELPPVWQSEEEFFRWIKVLYEKPIHRI